jgi:hypothetical protein
MRRVFLPRLAAAALLLCIIPDLAGAEPFQFSKDTLSFANETVFQHDDQPVPTVGFLHPQKNTYNRRCFVVCRGVLQFYKFARFDPKAPPPDDKTLARLIRKIARRPVWKAELPESERIVIPGYPNLRTLSAKRSDVIQRNLGYGWPTYVRPGNFCFVFPPSIAHQKKTLARMDEELAKGKLTILWLTMFPSMALNHTLLVYDRKVRGHGEKAHTVYTVYDPNYADKPREMSYWPATGQLFYGKTFYSSEAWVKARAVFRSPWQ